MNGFGRVQREIGFTQIPAHTDQEYLKEFHKRNDKGGFCTLVGLEE